MYVYGMCAVYVIYIGVCYEYVLGLCTWVCVWSMCQTAYVCVYMKCVCVYVE